MTSDTTESLQTKTPNSEQRERIVAEMQRYATMKDPRLRWGLEMIFDMLWLYVRVMWFIMHTTKIQNHATMKDPRI